MNDTAAAEARATDASAGPHTHSGNGNSPGVHESAEWISGAQWADELEVDPDSGIGEVLGAEAWKAVRKFARRNSIDLYHFESDGMAFSDFTALPREVWRAASPKIEITRDQVAEFAEDSMTDDPHEIGERLKAARAARSREKDRTERALKKASIPGPRLFTLAEVERIAGADVAGAVVAMIERANRRAWNTPKPHNYAEHEYLITAAELYAGFSVAVPMIGEMSAATDQDRDAALSELAVARRRHQIDIEYRSKAGDLLPLDLATEVLSMSKLSELEPVRPLIRGFLYCGQLAELVGDPGTGKTFAALGMALSVASGRRWCGYPVPAAMPVVYVAAEGASGIRARVLAWCSVNEVDPTSLEDTFLVVPRAVQIGEDAHMSQLIDLVSQIGAGLVVFDTRARCTVGLEENNATEQGKAIKRADTLNQLTGAAVLVVHHTAANSSRGRGSTAWDGALYSSLLLTSSGKGVQIECAKHKDAEDGCKHSFRLTPHVVSTALMPNDDADARSTMVLAGVDPMTLPDEDNLTETQEKVVSLVDNLGGDQGLTRTEIVKFALEQNVASRSAVYSAIKVLAGGDGRLVNTGTKNTPRFTLRRLPESNPQP